MMTDPAVQAWVVVSVAQACKHCGCMTDEDQRNIIMPWLCQQDIEFRKRMDLLKVTPSVN